VSVTPCLHGQLMGWSIIILAFDGETHVNLGSNMNVLVDDVFDILLVFVLVGRRIQFDVVS
jgi:hypothetical protein